MSLESEVQALRAELAEIKKDVEAYSRIAAKLNSHVEDSSSR